MYTTTRHKNVKQADFFILNGLRSRLVMSSLLVGNLGYQVMHLQLEPLLKIFKALMYAFC